METPTDQKWVDRKITRLEYLAKLFDEKGFHQIALEIRSLRTEQEIRNFHNVIKGWLF